MNEHYPICQDFLMNAYEAKQAVYATESRFDGYKRNDGSLAPGGLVRGFSPPPPTGRFSPKVEPNQGILEFIVEL